MSSSKSKRHAIADHLSRAIESMLYNLVEAVRLRESAKKLLTLDYAVGSTYECAACLDMGVRRGVWNEKEAEDAKQLLLRACMELRFRRQNQPRYRYRATQEQSLTLHRHLPEETPPEVRCAPVPLAREAESCSYTELDLT